MLFYVYTKHNQKLSSRREGREKREFCLFPLSSPLFISSHRRSVARWTLSSWSFSRGKHCRIPPPPPPLPLPRLPRGKGSGMDAGGEEQGSSEQQIHWTEKTGISRWNEKREMMLIKMEVLWQQLSAHLFLENWDHWPLVTSLRSLWLVQASSHRVAPHSELLSFMFLYNSTLLWLQTCNTMWELWITWNAQICFCTAKCGYATHYFISLCWYATVSSQIFLSDF